MSKRTPQYQLEAVGPFSEIVFQGTDTKVKRQLRAIKKLHETGRNNCWPGYKQKLTVTITRV